MRRIKITVSYDGTRFHGWQRQLELRTVQAELEDAVEAVTGKHAAVHGSGRTDSGVHAEAQVAHFSTSSKLAPEKLRAALNAHVGKDVAVIEAGEASKDFHARKSARLKTYRYDLYVSPVRPVLNRGCVYHVRSKLSLAAMRRAAKILVGRHDFRAFTDAQAVVHHCVRTVTNITVTRKGAVWSIKVTGEGFLWKMVRSIAGALLDAGRGKLTTDDVREILESGRRELAAPTLPARGLTLVCVEY